MNIVSESCPTYKKKRKFKLSQEQELKRREKLQEWALEKANNRKQTNLGTRH